MTFNAANRKDISRAAKQAKLEEQQRGEVIAALMSTIPGRKFVWDKLTEAHIFSSSFSHDPISMAYAEGERNLGLKLLNDVMHFCPEDFILTMREANGRRTESSAAERPSLQDGDGGVEEPDGDETGGADYRHPDDEDPRRTGG